MVNGEASKGGERAFVRLQIVEVSGEEEFPAEIEIQQGQDRREEKEF
jgi:hypothetical protein